jgi:mono/diheme cytochrome c family protein
MTRIPGRALVATFLLSLAPSGASADADTVARGRALVEANCARCHAVGVEDASPLANAPAFRTLSERYPVDALEEAFAEGIVTGHPDMPEFEATPDQIAAIIDYIASLQPR